MNVIQSLIADLREKRLWPIAVALLVALVAVPVLLSGGSNASPPVASVPPAGASSAAVPALPAVSVTATPSHARLTGRRRDPFTQQVKARSTGSKAASSAKSKSSSSSSSTKRQTASGSVGGTTTTVTSTPTTTTTPAQPTPTGLTASEAYHVTIALTSPG
ncbi:MAG: hypothetical protein M3071_16055, partial [Actinomycetota bacterium]|nr:hypothetical protein [Actinomycetota bacterium]